MLSSYIGKRVSVVTVDGRNLVGILHSADQVMNLVLSNCVERELAPAEKYFSLENQSNRKVERQDQDDKAKIDDITALKEEPLGAFMIRGADVVNIGLIDVYAEARQNIKQWHGYDMPVSVTA